jgi:hypothetical protein
VKIWDFEIIQRLKGLKADKVALALAFLIGIGEAFLYFGLGFLALAIARVLPAIR